MFNRKLLGGFVLGICGTLLVMWVYRIFLLEKNIPYSVQINVTDSTLNKIKVKEFVKELNQSDSSIEKIASINKRIDDILIFGGVIVTLLIAINVGVYIKAESEVDKHFRDNFDKVKDKIDRKFKEIEEAAEKAQAEFELIRLMRTNLDSGQRQTQITDDNGNDG